MNEEDVRDIFAIKTLLHDISRHLALGEWVMADRTLGRAHKRMQSLYDRIDVQDMTLRPEPTPVTS